MSLRALAVVVLGLVSASRGAWAEDPRATFDEAVRNELYGGEAASQAAFELYLRAAQAGLPDAAFNIAVLLDSGRGVEKDVALAATWYARAAAQGHDRAAYNLGQLYEAGDGVPRNTDLAHAWFAASKLPAALARIAHPAAPDRGAEVTPPHLVSPQADQGLNMDTGLTEFVWTSAQQPEPAQYLIEICAFEGGWRELFSSVTDVSSVAVVVPRNASVLAWRVTTLLPKSARYAASDWTYVSAEQQAQSASQ
jgi:hypothetical protein